MIKRIFTLSLVAIALAIAAIFYFNNKKEVSNNTTSLVVDPRGSEEYENRNIVSFAAIDSMKIADNFMAIGYKNADTLIAYKSQTKAYGIVDIKNKIFESYGNYYSYDLKCSKDTIITIGHLKEKGVFFKNTYLQNAPNGRVIFDGLKKPSVALLPAENCYLLAFNNVADSLYYFSLYASDDENNKIDIPISSIFKNYYSIIKPMYYTQLFQGYTLFEGNTLYYKNRQSSFGLVYNLEDSSYKLFRAIDSFEFPQVEMKEVTGGRFESLDESYLSSRGFNISKDYLINIYPSHSQTAVSYIDFYDKANLAYKFSLVFSNTMGSVVSIDLSKEHPQEAIILNDKNTIYKIKINAYASKNI